MTGRYFVELDGPYRRASTWRRAAGYAACFAMFAALGVMLGWRM